MTRFISSLIIILTAFSLFNLFPETASANPWNCGGADIPERERGYYPYGEVIRAKFVFVAFPSETVDTLMYADLHQAAADSFIWYFKKQSRLELDFTSDSGILFHPGFPGFSGAQTSAPA